MKIFTYLFLILGISLIMACEKGEVYKASEDSKVVKLTLSGYIMQDTLEILKDGRLIYEAAETNFTPIGGYSNIIKPSELIIRKKGSETNIDTIQIDSTKFTQNITMFYDGEKLYDKIELTPVSSPENYGIRFSFVPNTTYNSDGLVDIDIYTLYIIFDPVLGTGRVENKYLKTISNVDNDFGEFIELPNLEQSDINITAVYNIKIYKHGTKTYPFKSNVEYPSTMEEDYLTLTLEKGKSHLFQIKPSFSDHYFNNYSISDVGFYFRQ